MSNADVLTAQRMISKSFERHFSFKEGIKEKIEKPTLFKRILKLLAYLVGILGPGLVIGEIFSSGFTSNINSLGIVFLLFSPFWIVYGLVNKNMPITLTYSLWFLVGVVLIFN